MAPEGFQTRPVAGGGSPQMRYRKMDSNKVPARRPTRRTGAPSAAGATRTVRDLWFRLKRLPEELGWAVLMKRAIGIGSLLVVLYFGFLWLTLPDIDDQSIFRAAQSTAITDRNGVELYRVHGEQDRNTIASDQIPLHMKNAIISIEDQRFFSRGCLDMRALARVVFTLGKRGGASTLTRQLARNALNLQRENIVNRKLKELILGCQLESRYSKDEVLAMYLNWIPFGQNAYGVEQASLAFLGKQAKDITLAEAAVIASLPQLPSYYSPYGRHVRTSVTPAVVTQIQEGDITDASEIDDDDVNIGLLGNMVGTGSTTLYIGGRSDQVLKNMLDQGMITEEERQKALEDLRTIVFAPSRESIRAPHFVLWTKDQVERMFQGTADRGILEQGGLKIETTLDWRLQQAAEEAVAKHRDTMRQLYGVHNIALVAMDPHTKEILAYVGNADYGDDEREGKVDMALVPRQPGSSFKPFIYAGAFLKGYSPATVIHDVRTKFGDYEPQNFEGGFWGLSTIRKALGGSRNIPAIKAYFLAGEEDTLLDFVSKIGAPTPKDNKPDQGYGPSMALGAAETPLLEMVQGFGTFADAGRFKPAINIRKITDRRGSLLPTPGEFDPSTEGKEVLDPRIAYQVTSILSDPSVRPGEYWRNILSVPGTEAAAKTGTSNKCLKRDDKQNCTERKPDNVWTIGYTPMIVAGVWAGNATSEALSDRADGINVAAPIWKDFMTRAQKIIAEDEASLITKFPVPDDMVQVQASQLSGELPTECTPVDLRKSDVFLRENAPSKADPACVRLTVDKVTGLLASSSCPAEAREERSFYLPKSLMGDRYPQWEQGVQEWAKTASGSLPLPIAPSEECDIASTPGRLEKPSVSLTFPVSNGAATYPSFAPRFEYTVGSAIRQISYQIDGKPAGTVTSRPFDGPIRVPRSVEKSGMHTLKITLTDEYYNEATDTVRFSFQGDASGPGISLLSPSAGTTFAAGDSIIMRADADDSEGGVKYVEFYLDGTLLSRKPRAPFELTYPIPMDTTPGPHTVRAVATDLADNAAVDEVEITVTGGSASSATAE